MSPCMTPIVRPATALLCALAAAWPAHAGTVEVSYDPAAAYADAGESPRDREATLAALAATLTQWGPRLPGSDSVLKVELRDVDLAGSVRPTRGGQPLRIVRGRADWPQIRLHYTLLEGGREARSGDETLSDLNYTWREPGYSAGEPLKHEKQLLADWFQARFVAAAPRP